MKKILPILLLSSVLFVCTNTTYAADAVSKEPQRTNTEHQKVQNKFEQRLNLTDKQKEKAKKIHQKGASQMKPVMKKKANLKNDIEQIKKSDLDENAKNEQIDKKIKEIKALDKKAHEIRKSNSKEFEKILTDAQKTELNKMKSEGRRNFERHHKPRPPFNILNPNFSGWDKGIFPPPPPKKFEK